jgi:hypothetical protein
MHTCNADYEGDKTQMFFLKKKTLKSTKSKGFITMTKKKTHRIKTHIPIT